MKREQKAKPEAAPVSDATLRETFEARDWLRQIFAGGWEPVARAAYEGFKRCGRGVLILKNYSERPEGAGKVRSAASLEYSSKVIAGEAGADVLNDYDPETQILCAVAEGRSLAVQKVTTPAGCPTPREVFDGPGKYYREALRVEGDGALKRRRSFDAPTAVEVRPFAGGEA